MVTRLRKSRLAAGVSQDALARIAGISQPAISRAERGQLQPTAPQLARLASVLGVPAARLLDPVEDDGGEA